MWAYAVAPAEFERQMEHVAGYAKLVSLEEVLEYLRGKPLQQDVVAVTFDDGYEDFVDQALPILDKYNVPVTLFASLPSTVRRELGTDRPLVSESVRDLPAQVGVGSHGLTHRKLKHLSRDEVRKELVEPRHSIRERFGKTPRFLAYPKGSFSPHTMELAREAGYEAAFTTLPRAASKKDNLFALPRVEVHASTSFGEFKARLTAAADWYCALRELAL